MRSSSAPPAGQKDYLALSADDRETLTPALHGDRNQLLLQRLDQKTIPFCYLYVSNYALVWMRPDFPMPGAWRPEY